MDGQVLGGGVIVLVAALLWLVYLLPSWYGRRQYDAAERNAVRLNQALRVLAETSETPQEVRLELNARTAAAQQRLAKQALAEREQAALEGARVDLERARTERLAAEAAARLDMERVRTERIAAEAAARRDAEQARAERAAAEARSRAEAAARRAPSAGQAHARRRLRLVVTILGVAGLGAAGWGVHQAVTTGAQVLMWSGVAAVAASGLVLQRMSRVAARATVRPTADAAAPRRAVDLQDVELEQQREWAPRELPKPLTASAGSRASAVLDVAAAREALRQAAREEAMRARGEVQRPPSIDAARAARAAGEARMDLADDAAIEAHVRRLLERRAAGQ